MMKQLVPDTLTVDDEEVHAVHQHYSLPSHCDKNVLIFNKGHVNPCITHSSVDRLKPQVACSRADNSLLPTAVSTPNPLPRDSLRAYGCGYIKACESAGSFPYLTHCLDFVSRRRPFPKKEFCVLSHGDDGLEEGQEEPEPARVVDMPGFRSLMADVIGNFLEDRVCDEDVGDDYRKSAIEQARLRALPGFAAKQGETETEFRKEEQFRGLPFQS